MWSSGLLRPTYQTRTSMPDASAFSRRAAIVFPPSVVSNAKSNRSAIARSSKRRPCCHAAALASTCAMPGLADRIRRAASSGLKYSPPCCRSIAPAMLLFPAPLVPARTSIRGVWPALATLARSRDRRFAELPGRGVERRPHAGAGPGRLHPGEQRIELAAERVELALGRPRQSVEFVEGNEDGLRRIVLGDDDDSTPDDHLEKTAELVLGHRRRERGGVDALAPMIAEGGERPGSASRASVHGDGLL